MSINQNFDKGDIWWLEDSLLNKFFTKLNKLNLSLQGTEENIITITGKLKAFEVKLQLWIKKSKDLKKFAEHYRH
jgi:hypothetical protein